MSSFILGGRGLSQLILKLPVDGSCAIAYAHAHSVSKMSADSSSSTEREELGCQYSPSRWSSRLAADIIVETHCEVTAAATKTARETLRCELGIEYVEPGGPVLDVYHPQSTTGQRPLIKWGPLNVLIIPITLYSPGF